MNEQEQIVIYEAKDGQTQITVLINSNYRKIIGCSI
jgi:hypothetical protein